MTSHLSILNPLAWSSTTYFILIAVTFLQHFRISPSAKPLVRFLRETLLIVPAILFYFLVRGLVAPDTAQAMRHARRIIHFERWLGIYWEPAIQHRFIAHHTLVDLGNWVYIWAHWPLLSLIIIWLVLAHHDAYPRYRNAMMISGIIGMTIFLLYPVAPPRLVPNQGFTDTVTVYSQSYRILQPPALVDPFASMPSLHFGWDLLMGLAVIREARFWSVKVLGMLMPVAMLAAIVVTGNHYIVDALAGGSIVIVAIAAADQLDHQELRSRLRMISHRPSTSPKHEIEMSKRMPRG